ncbi:hypothetical protein DK45_4180 [Bordetella bronchiseptica]|nr:hypothetical protein DK45_4180 [Bordetella bronchiseptica]
MTGHISVMGGALRGGMGVPVPAGTDTVLAG